MSLNSEVNTVLIKGEKFPDTNSLGYQQSNGDCKHVKRDNIGVQQASLSTTKAKDSVSDVKVHAEASLSDPLTESQHPTPPFP